jgi:hypothetical protein
MALVEERDDCVPVEAACDALAVSRASLYRTRQPPPPRAAKAARAPSPRRLGDAERQRVLDTLHLPEFADQPPTEVYATLLGRGIYLASIRTMYRLLAAAGETKELYRLALCAGGRLAVGSGKVVAAPAPARVG